MNVGEIAIERQQVGQFNSEGYSLDNFYGYKKFDQGGERTHDLLGNRLKHCPLGYQVP